MYVRKERGTVFLYILIAVALIAGLTYAMSSGNRGNTSGVTDQQAKLAAQEIIDYGNSITAAVQKLKLRGCADTEISFENGVEAGYVNGNAPSDNSCHVFDLNGGAIAYQAPGSNLATGGVSYTGDVPFDAVASTAPELSFQLNDIDSAVCYKINEALGIMLADQDAIQDEIDPVPDLFVGTYGSVVVTDLAGDEIADFSGKINFCRKDAAGDYFYLSVLIAR